MTIIDHIDAALLAAREQGREARYIVLTTRESESEFNAAFPTPMEGRQGETFKGVRIFRIGQERPGHPRQFVLHVLRNEPRSGGVMVIVGESFAAAFDRHWTPPAITGKSGN